MTKRQDGKETRMRLLNAACAEFSEKGYRDAKVVDICKRAEANLASVNYYFNDKASLYAETWIHVIQHFEDYVFSSLREGSPQQRLRQYIQIILEGYTVNGTVGYFSRLYMMEMVNPTGLIEDLWREAIGPQSRIMHKIIRDIIGQEANRLSVQLCELSIFNQCRVLTITRNSDLEFFLEQPIDKHLINRLVDHITRFSLAGIKTIAEGSVAK